MTDESLVPRQRDIFDDLILEQNRDALAQLTDEPLVGFTELFTGALAAGHAALLPTAARVLQAVVRGRAFKQLAIEITKLRDDGRIPDDFANEKKYKYGFWSYVDMFKAVDSDDPPDADKFEALMALFYGVNRMTATDVERMLNYRYLQIILRLKSGELLLLKALYEEYAKGNSGSVTRGLTDWAKTVAQSQGHEVAHLVIVDQTRLISEGLIMGTHNNTANDANRSVFVENARLSDLGIAVCRNIERCIRESRSEDWRTT
jgi:hypothetical protein